MATTTAEERAEAAKMRSGEGGRSQATGAVDMARFPPVEIEVRVGAASQRSHAQTRAIARLPRGHAGDASCTVWLPVSTRMRMWGMRSVCENRATCEPALTVWSLMFQMGTQKYVLIQLLTEPTQVKERLA
jgi:hypothetical protein